MATTRYPRRIESVHVESIEGELCVYDIARTNVHALNRTAAFVWQRCDGVTTPSEIAAVLSAETSIDDAEAVVLVTLQELAAAQLLAAPLDEVAPVSRRDLLRGGVAAAIPAVYSIVAPSPAEAQSPPDLNPPTLTSVSPNQGLRGATVAVTLTGTNFIVGGTTVTVAGGGVTVNNVVVGSSTSLTASFVLDLAASGGSRAVTVTTVGGTSGAQTFTVTLPASGSVTFNYTGGPETFTVPAGVASVTILATGAGGGAGSGAGGGLGGRTTATVAVTPGAALTVHVGGQGLGTSGGFNGGGAGTGFGGWGGGASSVRDGANALVVVGGGGGGGGAAAGGGGIGGAGGGLIADPGQTPPLGGGGGGGGSQSAGGAGGTSGSGTGTGGSAGVAGTGGASGADQSGNIGGGGGGGGYFGGGGGGGGNPGVAGGGGGGGGSSFTAPGATAVVHEQGVKAANGFVTISW